MHKAATATIRNMSASHSGGYDDLVDGFCWLEEAEEALQVCAEGEDPVVDVVVFKKWMSASDELLEKLQEQAKSGSDCLELWNFAKAEEVHQYLHRLAGTHRGQSFPTKIHTPICDKRDTLKKAIKCVVTSTPCTCTPHVPSLFVPSSDHPRPARSFFPFESPGKRRKLSKATFRRSSRRSGTATWN